MKNFYRYPTRDAVGMSRNTVKKYVDGLIKKRLIEAEPTKITTKHGRRNGNLCYTVRPIDDAVRANYDRQMTRLEDESRRQKAHKKLAEYDRQKKERYEPAVDHRVAPCDDFARRAEDTTETETGKLSRL